MVDRGQRRDGRAAYLAEWQVDPVALAHRVRDAGTGDERVPDRCTPWSVSGSGNRGARSRVSRTVVVTRPSRTFRVTSWPYVESLTNAAPQPGSATCRNRCEAVGVHVKRERRFEERLPLVPADLGVDVEPPFPGRHCQDLGHRGRAERPDDPYGSPARALLLGGHLTRVDEVTHGVVVERVDVPGIPLVGQGGSAAGWRPGRPGRPRGRPARRTPR